MRNLDKLVVVDLEATCWQDATLPPHMLPGRDKSEIIEVGVCTLDYKTLEVSDAQGIIVKPVNTEVSDFCTKLTTITQADVDKGMSLEAACKILRKQYDSKNRIWASYGRYDEKLFVRECTAKSVTFPFGSFHLNIKAVLETVYGRELGMSDALTAMGMTLEGTHHRGVDDSVNIAKLYADTLRRCRK